jgi:hypothetical protein
MTREVVGTILVLMVFAITIAIAVNQKKKRRAQEQELQAPHTEVAPQMQATTRVQYVATVFSDKPLTKVIAYGLGPRGHGRLYASENGFFVERDGETDFFIPKTAIKEIGFNSATIDRGVEKKGLVSINWSLGETGLSTQIRFNNAAERDEMLAQVSL